MRDKIRREGIFDGRTVISAAPTVSLIRVRSAGKRRERYQRKRENTVRKDELEGPDFEDTLAFRQLVDSSRLGLSALGCLVKRRFFSWLPEKKDGRAIDFQKWRRS